MIDSLDHFHFLRPAFLWGIPVLLVIWGSGFITRRNKRVSWEEVIAPHLRPFMLKRGNEKVQLLMQILVLVMLLLGIIALAGPAWIEADARSEKVESPVFILVELTPSMLEEDLSPNRLEFAKIKIRDLLKEKPGARIGLLAYAGTAHSVVPLTEDYRLLEDYLEAISPDIMPRSGSNTRAGLVLADTLASGAEAPARILLFTDNEGQEEKDIILGYTGSSDNFLEVIPVIPNSDQNSEGNSTGTWWDTGSIERKNLQVNPLTMDNSDMEALAKRINENLEFTPQSDEEEREWEDMGWYFIIPLTVMLLLWFRRGWVLFSLIAVVFTSCSGESRFADLWFTRDYQGQLRSSKGDFIGAAQRYEDDLRKGVAYFKAGEYEKAKAFFSRDSSARGSYNLGLALIRLGDTLGAQRAFSEAAKKDPEMQEAKDNEALVRDWVETSMEKAKESATQDPGNNMENKDMEDLGGGGQEATEEDMEKERKEETVETDVRMGKESGLPPDQDPGDVEPMSGKIMLRKVKDDPATFLKAKFEYQERKKKGGQDGSS